MKVVSCLLLAFALCASEVATEEETHVQHLLNAIAEHSSKNAQFAELEATVLNAIEADSSETKSGRSPMGEIVAMTDMMIIQVTAELDKLNTDKRKRMKQCKKTLAEYAECIDDNKKKRAENLAKAQEQNRQWNPRYPDEIEGIETCHITRTKVEVDDCMPKYMRRALRVRDAHKAAQDARTKKRQAFEKALAEHDDALKDVANIRHIVQNSALDDQSNKTPVAAGAHGLLEDLASTCHPRLHDVVLLTQKALTQENGVDAIYRLLYQTRDQLLQSKSKLIKGEKASVANWRTNSVAFSNDYNDLLIERASQGIRAAALWQRWGDANVREADYLLTMQEHAHKEETCRVTHHFEDVACKEDKEFFRREIASKKNEKNALEKVQKLLVTLKWSNKVYAAIQKVSEGVIYLKGKYNIRSGLNRFMTVNKNMQPSFTPNKAGDEAMEFTFDLIPADLSYHIKDIRAPAKGKKVGKTYYLTQMKNGEAKFTPAPSMNGDSNWFVDYDKKSGFMFVRNKKSKDTLFVDSSKGKYTLSTISQTEDARSQFRFERKDYTEVGCFKTKQGTGMLTDYTGVSNTMNTAKCHTKCVGTDGKNAKGYKFFGLAEGGQCYCSKSMSLPTAPFTDCGFICDGRDGDLCGGKFRVLVYGINGKKLVRPNGAKHGAQPKMPTLKGR
jgi:hypothetical protein